MEQEIFKYINGYRWSCKYYLDGNVNIILSVPHGGILISDNVPDRTDRAYSYSLNTNDVCYDGECDKISLIRDSLDFNREIVEATLNHPEAISAYENNHMYLDNSIGQIHYSFDKGLLIDIHGHTQGDYSMIGYMLSREQLNQNDLSDTSFKTSIESLCRSNRNEMIRGETSFGSIFERYGLGVIYPSFMNPKSASRKFFSCGYIIQNYFPKINAIQIELSRDIRIGENKRMNAQNVARSIVEYMKSNDLLTTK